MVKKKIAEAMTRQTLLEDFSTRTELTRLCILSGLQQKTL